MGAVFVSYRRGDSEGQARALFNELEDRLGRDSVFMDVDSIALGRDFRQILQERLNSCDLMLALIGPEWLDAKDPAGNRRLENPTDFVRQEIGAALKRNIPVTPVFVREAQPPPPERLPDDLKDLAYRNGFELSHARWESDVKEMLRRLGLTEADVHESREPVNLGGRADRPGLTGGRRSVGTWARFSWKTMVIGGGATLLVLVGFVVFLMYGGGSRSFTPAMANTNLFGGDYKGFDVTTAEMCETECKRDLECRAWTFVRAGVEGPQARCYLKGVIPPLSMNSCCVSGYQK